MKYYVGVDLGTSAVKLLLVDEKGTIHKEVNREYPLYFPQPGWSEQDPAHWWAACVDGLKELVSGIDTSSIAGIGAGGQMHGLVALDENDAVIRPAILWNDGRTAEETAWLNEAIGKEQLSACTANIAFAGFTAPQPVQPAQSRAPSPDGWLRPVRTNRNNKAHARYSAVQPRT